MVLRAVRRLCQVSCTRFIASDRNFDLMGRPISKMF